MYINIEERPETITPEEARIRKEFCAEIQKAVERVKKSEQRKKERQIQNDACTELLLQNLFEENGRPNAKLDNFALMYLKPLVKNFAKTLLLNFISSDGNIISGKHLPHSIEEILTPPSNSIKSEDQKVILKCKNDLTTVASSPNTTFKDMYQTLESYIEKCF